METIILWLNLEILFFLLLRSQETEEWKKEGKILCMEMGWEQQR